MALPELRRWRSTGLREILHISAFESRVFFCAEVGVWPGIGSVDSSFRNLTCWPPEPGQNGADVADHSQAHALLAAQLADSGLDVEAIATLKESGYEQKVAAERGTARGVGGGLPAT
jgi:hypothetical protein